MSLLKIEKDRLTLDGEPFYLACGDIQYFRIHPSEWKRRLEIMKDFGLSAIQTYCPWNLHEPTEGSFDFTGLLDLAGFLRTANEVGLKVLLRPSPYICGEWDFGGLPWWLLKDRHMRIRCADSRYMEKVRAYYKRICAEFLPFLSTKGGPIIAVCIENEYGTFGTDLGYLRFLADTLRENGVDVPLYQTDCSQSGIAFTKPLGIWQATNYRIESETAVPALKKLQPDMPPFVGEYWSGRSVYWGESGAGREIAPIASAYRKALDLGAYVSFYMFAGGTNFGFMNGSRVTKPFDGSGTAKFRAITTSYDCDALIREDGRVSEKYYACRRELDEYLGKPVRTYRLPDPPAQEIFGVGLCETAGLFENLGALASKTVKSPEPLTFEELDCGYGFVLYTATLPHGYDGELPLTIEDLHDRALVFVDGEYRATLQRDFPDAKILCRADIPHRVDILVENLGRVNSRPQFAEEKGILGEVKFGVSNVYGFENRPLQMTGLSGLTYSTGDIKGSPRFYRGRFNARAGISTNLHMKGWSKGFAVLNGFNLGRFWSIGPQETLYVPGALLREGENELVIFEMYEPRYENGRAVVDFIGKSLLDGEYRDEIN